MVASRVAEIQIHSPEKNNVGQVFNEIQSEPDLKVLRAMNVILVDTPLHFPKEETMPTEDLLNVADNLRNASAKAFARRYRMSEDQVLEKLDIRLVSDEMSIHKPVVSIQSGTQDFFPKEWGRLVSAENSDQIHLKVMLFFNQPLDK